MTVRQVREDDAREFLELLIKLDNESEFMMVEPGERRTTTEEQRERIKSILSRENRAIFVAVNDGALIGYIAALGGHAQRNKRCAHVVIGIIRAYAGRGIGKKLFISMEEWAQKSHLHRLELTVMTHNKIAIGLYKKLGYTVEGTKVHSLRLHDAYIDEYYMAKLLD